MTRRLVTPRAVADASVYGDNGRDPRKRKWGMPGDESTAVHSISARDDSRRAVLETEVRQAEQRVTRAYGELRDATADLQERRERLAELAPND